MGSWMSSTCQKDITRQRFIGLYQMFHALQQVASDLGEGVSGIFDLISPGVLFGGMRIGLIPVFYGVIIYLISLFVQTIKKPRL